MLKERRLLKISLFVGIGLLPILLRKPGLKKWSVIHLTNAISSHIMDSYLVKTKKLKYPVRLFPKIFKTQVIYDYLICPLLSILYCQSTYNSGLFSTVLSGFLFAIPQTFLEYIAVKKTKIIQYGKGWTWVHSFLGIAAVKIAFRGLFELIKPQTTSMSNESFKKSNI